MNYGQAWEVIDAAENNPPAPGTPEAAQLQMAQLSVDLHRPVNFCKFDVGPRGDNPNDVGIVIISLLTPNHNCTERVKLDEIFTSADPKACIKKIAERCAEQLGRQIFLRNA